MAASMLNAAGNPDGSGTATVGLTHSPQIDVTAGAVSVNLGLSRVLTPISINVLELIVLDHNRLRALYDCYTKLGPGLSAENRQLLSWELIMCMSEHAAKEELVLYPAIRAVFGDMEADKCLQEHAQVKRLTAQLDTMVSTDPAFDMAVRGAVEAMLAHVAEEEGTLLPRMGDALTPVTLLQLGLQFEAAKVRAPTRPHPEAPNLPPFNEASLAAAKQVDTALDQARMPSVVPAMVALKGGGPEGAPTPQAVPTEPAGTTSAGMELGGGAEGGASEAPMEVIGGIGGVSMGGTAAGGAAGLPTTGLGANAGSTGGGAGALMEGLGGGAAGTGGGAGTPMEGLAAGAAGTGGAGAADMPDVTRDDVMGPGGAENRREAAKAAAAPGGEMDDITAPEIDAAP
ncbi:hypothetical protein MNEG_7797 [Monoraphidium neglectum]|uniref:Hemerythrin-like domain-containing protein n=1 Tax=Monoraphidium neglectum TaxID=145388 RepID=A0A0D2JLU4_9CHLO|nr:hypothetical protein MNEG_7797 [Monoraphidium neglectum]KIZ00163.1 hypothetical protein MNEG_7797 [Monoraphidium neglectum]|eukprot:XP_013899182.1 hypothetical protein MNEG_7797 [Monoraphidium neglectum]